MQNTERLTLAFEAEVTVHQTIRLLTEISEQALIDGLKAGSIITTLWHTQGESGAQPWQCEVLDLSRPLSQQRIGYIESQQVDGEYHGFR